MAQLISRHTRHVSNIATIILFVIPTLWGGALSHPIRELDLENAHRSEPIIRFVGGIGEGGGVGGNGIKPAQPASVEIVGRDPSNCQNGRLNIQLANTGQRSLTLPWSVDGAHTVVAKSAGDEIRFDDLNITIASQSGVNLANATLYGNPSIPESEVTLQPGQSVLLRNIRTQFQQQSLCNENLVAAIVLATHRAIKADGGYSLMTHSKWRIRSQ